MYHLSRHAALVWQPSSPRLLATGNVRGSFNVYPSERSSQRSNTTRLVPDLDHPLGDLSPHPVLHLIPVGVSANPQVTLA